MLIEYKNRGFFATDGFVGYHRGARKLIHVDRLGSLPLMSKGEDCPFLVFYREENEVKKVGIIMGSDSDLGVVEKAIDVLKEFGVPCEVRVCSAHLTPVEAAEFAKSARANGFGALIAAAGKAAHLAGAIAANTTLPVIGIPVKSSTLDGLDALLSTVQMPTGIPVATVAIDGAANAALIAIEVLSVSDDALAEKLEAKRKADADKVRAKDAAIREKYSTAE